MYSILYNLKITINVYLNTPYLKIFLHIFHVLIFIINVIIHVNKYLVVTFPRIFKISHYIIVLPFHLQIYVNNFRKKHIYFSMHI